MARMGWTDACTDRPRRPPDLHGDRDNALSALRDRPHHQPYPRIRLTDSYASCTLLRRHRCAAESLHLTHWPAFHPRGGGLHPPYRGVVHSVKASNPVLYRQALLPQEVRHEEDPRSLLRQATGRDGSRSVERGSCGGGEGDDATGTRLFMVAPREGVERRTEID